MRGAGDAVPYAEGVKSTIDKQIATLEFAEKENELCC